jgi:hemerythrin-like metal-binding protein
MIFIPRGEPVSTLLWSSDYNVNIQAIDDEHKLLVSIIDDIAHSLQSHSSLQSQPITDSLHRLSDYIRTHFESEERLFLFNHYPEFTQHKDEHTKLLARIDNFEQRFKADQWTFNENMLLYLKDWLLRHIILYDCKFGNYYREKELINHFA